MLVEILTNVWYYTAFALGVFTLACWLYRTCDVWGRSLGFGTRCTLARYGADSWAVVTGATDGIGKECARYLANEGFNIVLISRTLSKLEAVAKEIQLEAKENGKHINTRVVKLDFTDNFDAPTFAKLYKENLKDLEISILVNNVGMAGAIK